MVDERTLPCGGCGNETFKIKWEMKHNGDSWAECSECGRPTSVFGEGWQRQRMWESRQ